MSRTGHCAVRPLEPVVADPELLVLMVTTVGTSFLSLMSSFLQRLWNFSPDILLAA